MLAAHPAVELTVFFCCDHGQRATLDVDFGTRFAWERSLTSGYAHEYIPSIHPQPDPYGFWRLTNPSLWARLTRSGFDAVMPVGWGFASCWLAVAAAKAHDLRLLLRAESHLASWGPRPAWKSVARRAVLSALFRQVDAFLSIGTRNTELYRAHGVPDDRIFLTPYAVDNDFFLAHAARLEPRRVELRAALGVQDDRPIIVSSGKLIERKAPLDVLRAFAMVRRHIPAMLVFAGDGVLRSSVEALALATGVADDVRITGFKQQHELCEAYAAADLFAFPSHFETWGLVLNEAMLFGLPAICTDQVPAHADLVVAGETGEVYSAGDVSRLSEIMEAWLVDRAGTRRMGCQARARVKEWSLERGVQGVVDALASVSLL